MEFTAERTRSFIDTLLALGQESAEHADMSPELYADLFELIHILTDHLNDLAKEAEKCE